QGPNAATGVVVTDLLPAEVDYVSGVASQGAYDDGTGVWSSDARREGDTATLTITAEVHQATEHATVTNDTTVDGAQADDDSADDSASADIDATPVADLSVAKSVSDAAPSVGDTVTYTTIVTNQGPNAATGVVVTDLLPAEVDYVSGVASQGAYDDGTGVWAVGSLANAGTATLTITVEVLPAAASGTVTNVATVDGDQADDDAGDDSASADIDATPVADLNVAKSVSDAAPSVGDTVTYTITVTNQGPNAATGVV